MTSNAQDPSYYVVAEWNGPYYHVINGSGQYAQGKVDDPVVDIPFMNPSAIITWENGAGVFYTYVVDAFNDRVQFFQTDISRTVENITSFVSPPIAGGDFGNTAGSGQIMFTHGGVIPGSEVITIDGTIFLRVNSTAGYGADDDVYSIVYIGVAGVGGVATLPLGNTFDGSEAIAVEYAYSSSPANAGQGDIDYAKADAVSAVNGAIPGEPFGITELIPNNAGHPTTFENLAAIAYNQNTAGSTFADIYLVDAGDAGEKLIAYRIEEDANTVFDWVSTYDGPLSYPSAVAVAQSGANVICTPGAVTQFATANTPQLSCSVRNNILINNHSYTFTVIVSNTAPDAFDGLILEVTDNTVGNVIAMLTPTGSGPVNYDNVVPGIRITWTIPGPPVSAVIGETATIAAGSNTDVNEYLFICDTGNSRIKVIKGADNGDPATNGFESDWFAGEARTEVYWLSDGISPSQSFVSGCRAEEFSFRLFTGDYQLDPSTWTEWTQVYNFAGSTPSDLHFTCNYETQVITLGDGVFGAIPNNGDWVIATYNESPDALDYGQQGTGIDQFNAPQGLAARWNLSQGWYDVYVADTGNNRIVKLKFCEGNTISPPVMVWVTAWDCGSAAGDLLDSPTGLTVIEDGLNQVWLFVCNTGNDRLLVFRDLEAEPDGTGGNEIPTYSRTIGAQGDSLGYFSDPVGVSTVLNDIDNDGIDEVDIYVVDAQRNYVEKFQEGDSPSLSVDYSDLPQSLPPSGSYTFNKVSNWAYFTQNAPAGSYIRFFYSDSLNAENPILCADVNVSPSATSFNWVFSQTPSAAPGAGDYYLYAKLFNPSGVVLAESNSSFTQILTLDPELMPGLSIFDCIDADRYLYIQNGAERILNLTVDYPDSVVAVNFTGTFPTDIIQITAIEEGEAWQGLQNNGTLFSASYNNTAGTFSVNSSVLGSNTGLTNGVYTVARITLSVDSNAVTTINRDTSGTFELLSGSLTDYKGESISGAQLNDLTLLAGYLGDIATAGADPGTIPNMIPTPDGIIGYDDLVVFTMGWNGLGGVKDPISDLGPTTGSVPDLAANPDDKYDVADLLAFTQMISWYAGNIASFPCEGFFSGGGSGIISSDLRKIGDQLTLTINAEGAVNLMCAYLKIDYNPGLYEMVSVKDGGFLSHNADVFFLPLSSPASVELYIARLSGNSPAISGCGKLAEFTFKIKAESSAPFNIYYDLRDNSSRIMDSGNIFDVSGGYPSDYRLEQNYPNPFNAETMIDFQLPSASNVKIEVFNLLGESVKLLLDERLSAGYYKVSWNGRDYNDRPLASGIYFYSIRAGDLSQLKKMILMK